MADFFKILKADPLGEPWTPKAPKAKPVQNWWCQVEGQDKDVSIGKQVGNDLRPGMYVYGDLKYAKSQKGTEYWRFDSQKVPDDVQRPQDDPGSPAQAVAQQAVNSDQMPAWFNPVYSMIEYIYKEMKKMDASDNVDLNEVETQPETKGVEQVGGEEIDPEQKQMLDGIFGGADAPSGEETPEGV